MSILALLAIGYAVEHEAVWPSDIHRFRWSLEEVEAIEAFGCEQKRWCKAMGYIQLMEVLDWRIGFWTHLKWAKMSNCEYNLRELRTLIGRDAYFRGEMPECRMVRR